MLVDQLNIEITNVTWKHTNETSTASVYYRANDSDGSLSLSGHIPDVTESEFFECGNLESVGEFVRGKIIERLSAE